MAVLRDRSPFRHQAIKLHHFRHVLAIAEQGGLRAGARHLGLAQPALTRSLGEIERELGVALFERHARGMEPTPAGRAFAQRATLVLGEVRRAREDAGQIGGGGAGAVSVGLSIAAHLAMLPKALGPFRIRFPEVSLHVVEGFYPTLETGLRSGEVDFYVGPSPERALPPELSIEHLFENTRSVLCRMGHPLAAARSLADLAGAEWATTSITVQAEQEFEALFAEHGLPTPRLVLRSQSALTLIVALMSSDLLAMAPVQWTAFAPTADTLATIPIRERLPAPRIALVRRADVPLTPAASHLADLLLRAVPASADETLELLPVRLDHRHRSLLR